MTDSTIKVNTKNTSVQIVLVAAAVVVLAAVWFGVRWQYGNMLAELTPLNQPNSTQIAKIATSLAPSDPLPQWLAASKEKEIFSAESIERSVVMFEEVVRLSPNDFRWWIELGRAYEQAEKPEKAENAFLQAIELAPKYTYPRWQIGNFYLREGRSDDAFAQLKQAASNSHVYREQVFSLAWDYFDKDPARVEALATDAPEVRAGLAQFFAVRSSPDDSLRIWNTLTDQQKGQYPVFARNIAQGLYDKRFFRQSLEFARQLGIDADARIETVSNGSFETLLGNPNETMFGWKIFRGEGKLDIATDSAVKREGKRSLKVTFKGFSKPELHNVVQTIALQPLGRYHVSLFLRTENLKSGGMPVFEVINANDDRLLASSDAFPTGNMDWHEILIEFVAPENCEGIYVRTNREFCGGECPVTGIFWYDDVKIARLP